METGRTAAFLIMSLMLAGGLFVNSPDMDVTAVEGAGNEEIVTIWDNEVIFEGSDDVRCIDGIAIGEVNPDHDGNEIVWVARNGNTYVGHYDDNTGTWTYDDIWNTPGQQLTPAIGDIRPDLEGNEILVSGLSSGTEEINPGDGTATVLSRSGASWNAERVFTFSKLIHGCDIGDVDPTIPGEEGILTTFADPGTSTGRVYMIWYDQEAGEWNSSLIFHDGHNVRKVVIADILPEREGLELVTVSKSGNLTIAYGGKNGWTYDVIYENPDEPMARVAVGDIDPGAPGLEIYTGTDTSKVLGFKRNGDEWDMQEIFMDTDKIRGVWVGDVDPNVPGNELYSYGYSTRLVQITGTFGSGWTTKDIFMDSARAHDMKIGDVHPDEGSEIAIVGYSQNVTVISLREQTAAVPPSLSGENTATLHSGGSASIEIGVTSNIDVSVSVDEVDGVEISLSSKTMFLSGILNVNLKAGSITENSSITFNIYLHFAGGTLSYPISLDLEADDEAPNVLDMQTEDGDSLSEGDEVSWNDTLKIIFNEPISEASFEAAKDGGLLKVEWGGVVIDVLFYRSADGKTITIDLNEQVLIGDITMTLSGLKDEAGNEIETFSVKLSVTLPEDGEEDGSLVIIGIISAALIIVLVFGAVIFLMNRGRGEGEEADEEVDMPREPKLI